MKKSMYLVWFSLALVNLVFAVSGRGNLYYLVAALFLLAGIMASVGQAKQKQ